MIRIGLIGDRSDRVPAHAAIPLALALAATARGLELSFDWIRTDAVPEDAALAALDGIWCVPGSPYRDMEGALRAIRVARTTPVPFLGTCGGFQHAVIEYARNVMGWREAEHAETTPDAEVPLIAPLECALVEATDEVELVAGTRLAAAYGRDRTTERYRCSYGLNPRFQAELVKPPMRLAARDSNGEIRGLELDTHPFFVITLFQPERAAAEGTLPPVVGAFVAAAAGHLASRPAASTDRPSPAPTG